MQTLELRFMDRIPEELDEATIFVSIPYATVAHKCCCGCGNVVFTPLSPTDWSLTFDGESISLDPSIGNWSFSCRSHYWIERNRVRWSRQWSQQEVEAGRADDQRAKENYYGKGTGLYSEKRYVDQRDIHADESNESVWQKLKRWFKNARL